MPFDRSPTVNPYPEGIAATGIVEALGRNVHSAAPEPGVVTQVFVQVNDVVKAREPLFELDDHIDTNLRVLPGRTEVRRRAPDPRAFHPDGAGN